MWGKELTSRKWRARKIGATTPPHRIAPAQGDLGKIRLLPPPPPRRLLGTSDKFCYYPPPLNHVGFWRSRKRLKKFNNLNLAALALWYPKIHKHGSPSILSFQVVVQVMTQLNTSHFKLSAPSRAKQSTASRTANN